MIQIYGVSPRHAVYKRKNHTSNYIQNRNTVKLRNGRCSHGSTRAYHGRSIHGHELHACHRYYGYCGNDYDIAWYTFTVIYCSIAQYRLKKPCEHQELVLRCVLQNPYVSNDSIQVVPNLLRLEHLLHHHHMDHLLRDINVISHTSCAQCQQTERCGAGSGPYFTMQSNEQHLFFSVCEPPRRANTDCTVHIFFRFKI